MILDNQVVISHNSSSVGTVWQEFWTGVEKLGRLCLMSYDKVPSELGAVLAEILDWVCRMEVEAVLARSLNIILALALRTVLAGIVDYRYRQVWTVLGEVLDWV